MDVEAAVLGGVLGLAHPGEYPIGGGTKEEQLKGRVLRHRPFERFADDLPIAVAGKPARKHKPN